MPLYDGLGFPDAPYRYVGKTPAPSSASVAIDVRSGRAVGGVLNTSEKGPQLVLLLKPAAVATTADSVTVHAVPLAPDGLPPQGTFDGNVYRITVGDPGAEGVVRAGGLLLRAAVMTDPAPRVLFRASPTMAWRELRTSTSGRDVLDAALAGSGDYVLERPPGAKAISLGGSNGDLIEFIGVGGVAVFILALAVLRRRDSGSEDDDDWDSRPRSAST